MIKAAVLGLICDVQHQKFTDCSTREKSWQITAHAENRGKRQKSRLPCIP